jgi:hypothetical protein
MGEETAVCAAPQKGSSRVHDYCYARRLESAPSQARRGYSDGRSLLPNLPLPIEQTLPRGHVLESINDRM